MHKKFIFPKSENIFSGINKNIATAQLNHIKVKVNSVNGLEAKTSSLMYQNQLIK